MTNQGADISSLTNKTKCVLLSMSKDHYCTSAKCPVLLYPCCSKDARLPEQLQRAMAAEAEAAREARAKVGDVTDN